MEASDVASSFDVYPSNPLDKAATMYKDHKKSYNANSDKISYKGMMKQDAKVKSVISLNSWIRFSKTRKVSVGHPPTPWCTST